MIVDRGIVDGFVRVDIRVAAGVPWNDAFWIVDGGTRPLVPDWLRLRLVIRPDFDHPSLIRELVSDGATPEIVVVDADEAAFAFAVSHTAIAAIGRLTNRTTTYAQMLIAEYASADEDNRELWRGEFIIEPGLDT